MYANSGIANGGGGGSGGADGSNGNPSYPLGAPGGNYGGGAGGMSTFNHYSGPFTAQGAIGAVRIIYPGDARQFPSTRTADE